jgi:hypothetical protein
MTAYRVSFFNELTNSSGKLFKVCQRSVDIRTARSLERAVEAAKKRFARLEHVGEWRLHAQMVEVEAIAEADPQASPAPTGEAESKAAGRRRRGRSPAARIATNR